MAELRGNPRPPGLAFPTPEQLDTLAVPASEGPGPHDGQCVSPVTPATKQDQRQTSWIIDSSRPNFTFLIERELFAQEQILGRQRGLRSEAEGHQVEEIAKIKMPDLNCFDLEAAMNSVRGTARSMGVDVV